MSAYGVSVDTETGEYSVTVDMDTAAEAEAAAAAATAAPAAADEPSTGEQIIETARTYALPIGVALIALIAVAALRER
jgi:hypothetical protein